MQPNSIIYFENKALGDLIIEFEKKYNYLSQDDFCFKNFTDCVNVFNLINEKDNYLIWKLN